MARIRTIKPEFWDDEKVGGLPVPCRLLFIGLWNYADDYGVLVANALFLKSRIFLYDKDISEEDVREWLAILEKRQMIIPCIYEGNQYYLVKNFSKHQVINKKSRSRIIPEAVLGKLLDGSGSATVALEEEPAPEQGRETGTEEKEHMNRERFREEVLTFSGHYPSEMIEKFISYWTSPSKKPGKMRFEDLQVWNTEERLRAWKSRERGTAGTSVIARNEAVLQAVKEESDEKGGGERRKAFGEGGAGK